MESEETRPRGGRGRRHLPGWRWGHLEKGVAARASLFSQHCRPASGAAAQARCDILRSQLGWQDAKSRNDSKNVGSLSSANNSDPLLLSLS